MLSMEQAQRCPTPPPPPPPPPSKYLYTLRDPSYYTSIPINTRALRCEFLDLSDHFQPPNNQLGTKSTHTATLTTMHPTHHPNLLTESYQPGINQHSLQYPPPPPSHTHTQTDIFKQQGGEGGRSPPSFKKKK